jgi:phosphatidylserine/phosphatidylglycerophosphate/cardiolipin synthase-like enzyme
MTLLFAAREKIIIVSPYFVPDASETNSSTCTPR